MSSKDLGAAVVKNPRLLSMSVPKNLAQKLEWLKEQGIAAHKLGALICSYPLLVSFSLAKLQASRDLLVEGLAVPEESVASSGLLRVVLRLRLKNLLHCIDKLKNLLHCIDTYTYFFCSSPSHGTLEQRRKAISFKGSDSDFV